MIIKQTDEYTIHKKRSGRYEVVGQDKKNINGIDKSRILALEKLIEFTEPKKAKEEDSIDTSNNAPAAAPEATEKPAEESAPAAAPEATEKPAEESGEQKSD